MEKKREAFNFGVFLKSTRRAKKISRYDLATGICDPSMVTKLEGADRFATKILRDRLLERLGCYVGDFETFVDKDEYEAWIQRQKVVVSLKNGQIKRAMQMLDKMSCVVADGDALQKQFCYDMKALACKMQGKSYGEYIEKALMETVRFIDGEIVNKVLAPKECHLLLEYSVQKPEYSEAVLECVMRQAELCDDLYQKALFYPKYALYIAERAMKQGIKDIKEAATLLKKVQYALDVLYDANRLYYVMELTETKLKLCEYMRKKIDESKTKALELIAKWENEAKEYLIFSAGKGEWDITPYR